MRCSDSSCTSLDFFAAVGMDSSDHLLRPLLRNQQQAWQTMTSTRRHPSQSREHHEEIRHAVRLVFVIVPGGFPWVCKKESARLDGRLFRRFRSRDASGHFKFARHTGEFYQHVFHSSDKANISVQQDNQ